MITCLDIGQCIWRFFISCPPFPIIFHSESFFLQLHLNFSWYMQRRIKVPPPPPPPLQEKNQYDYTCNKNILFKVENLQEQVNCKNTSYPRWSLDNGLSGRGFGTSWRNESHPLITPPHLPSPCKCFWYELEVTAILFLYHCTCTLHAQWSTGT